MLTVEIKSVGRISAFSLLFLVTIAKGYACYRLFSVKRIVTLFLRKFVRKLIIELQDQDVRLKNNKVLVKVKLIYSFWLLAK